MGISSTSSAAATSNLGTTYSYSILILLFGAGFLLGFFMGFGYYLSLHIAYAMGRRSTARARSPAGKLIQQRTVNLTPFVGIQIYALANFERECKSFQFNNHALVRSSASHYLERNAVHGC
ncbi:unnamed protein product [Sphagnum troendelagicum]|uniref:Uncharacterized protein n=1 Tax=Sphagnum troendelagicum TaxID=128251 RepID=A0ABP0T837_9BRYO